MSDNPRGDEKGTIQRHIDMSVGNFHNDEMSGEGLYSLPNGERYEGQFRHGKFEGLGGELLLHFLTDLATS